MTLSKITTRHKVYILVGLLSAFVLVMSGMYLHYRKAAEVRPVARASATEKDSLSVYFPEQGRLSRKIVEVPKQLMDKGRADLLLRELKEAKCIPDRLRLHELALGPDGVLYLNLSKEFIDNNTKREISMVYGIVNSFIESFKNVSSVQLLVEGQPVYTRSGILYLFRPLQFNKELLED